MGSQLFENLQKASSTLEYKTQLRNSVIEVSSSSRRNRAMAGVTKMDASGLVTFASVGAQPLPSLSLPGPL